MRWACKGISMMDAATAQMLPSWPPSYDYIPEAHCPRAQTLLRPEGNNRNYNYVTYTLIYYL